MTSTIEELDRHVRELRAAQTAMTSNLLALEENPTYKLLCAARSSLRGRTASTVGPALEALNDLWLWFSLFSDHVDRIEQLRGTNRMGDDRLAKLAHLVLGAAITLPGLDVPFAQRGLLTGGATGRAICPDELLAAMTAAFESARDAVVQVEDAWNDLLPNLDRSRLEAVSLAARGTEVGLQPPPLKRAERALERLSADIAEDPLGARHSLDDNVAPLLHQADGELAALEAQRRSVTDGLPIARAQIARIAGLIERGRETLAEARQRVKAPVGLLEPLEDSLVHRSDRGLLPWLDRLTDLAEARDWDLAGRGLREWQALAKSIELAAEEVAAANGAPLVRRSELLGLLGAAKVKAAAAGLAEDEDIDHRYEAADAQLRARPCDLVAAEDLVSAYLAAVRARSGENPTALA